VAIKFDSGAGVSALGVARMASMRASCASLSADCAASGPGKPMRATAANATPALLVRARRRTFIGDILPERWADRDRFLKGRSIG
jgi:hypothetical protein